MNHSTATYHRKAEISDVRMQRPPSFREFCDHSLLPTSSFPCLPTQGKKMSVCADNVTDLRIPEGESGFSKSITAYICQAVIIPPEVTGYKAGVSSQPVSLADRLIGE